MRRTLLALACLAALILTAGVAYAALTPGDNVTVTTDGDLLAKLDDGRCVVQTPGGVLALDCGNVSPTSTPTPEPTATPTPEPTPSPTQTPDPTPDPTPTSTPTPDPTPEPTPTPTPTPSRDELGPARSHERDCGGSAGSITAEPGWRYIDCPGVSLPAGISHVTVIGSKFPTWGIRGGQDIYLSGHSAQDPMNVGPTTNADMLQIKRYPYTSSGEVPTDVTLRYQHFHDLTRTDSSHTDGIQIMAVRDLQILDSVFENIDVQPIFARTNMDPSAGMGPIDGITVARTRISTGPQGYYAIRIAGNGDPSVPSNVHLEDLDLGENVSVDRAAYNAGFSASGLSGGHVVIAG